MTDKMRTYAYKDTLEVGIDEAGRGPMFGRVYIGAAILPMEDMYDHSMMKDSKKLSLRKRLMAYDYIKENAIDYNVFYHTSETIDNMNILNATMDGMHRVLDGMQVIPDHILVDGNLFKDYYNKERNQRISHSCIIKGDSNFTSIAAASILAKVSRDKYVEEICDRYPILDEYYGLVSNKGYGSKQHMDGIKKYGITKYHRKSFGICARSPMNNICNK